jgi:hypothetical protein
MMESMKSSQTSTLPGKTGWSRAARIVARTGEKDKIGDMRLLKKYEPVTVEISSVFKITYKS